MDPGLAIGLNVTYSCPDGQVFDSDWFATPRVRLTCQQNGAFDSQDWQEARCVLRKYTCNWWHFINTTIVSFPSHDNRVLRLHYNK